MNLNIYQAEFFELLQFLTIDQDEGESDLPTLARLDTLGCVGKYLVFLLVIENLGGLSRKKSKS